MQSEAGTSSSTSMDIPNLFDVRDLVAVVTGGGSGIGLMIATALENNGALVFIVGRRKHILEQGAAEKNKFGKIIPLQGDITSRESLLSIVSAVKARVGHVDLLVNNAGIANNILSPPLDVSQGIAAVQKRLWETGTPEEFTATLDTNVTAAYYTTVAFLELLHAGNTKRPSDRPTSQVIFMSSGAGFRRDEKQFSFSYGLSKVAITQMGKIFSNMLSTYKIRSNVVAPGIFPTDLVKDLIPAGEASPSLVPLERYGTAEDMAGLILYLASRAGSYVNGGVFLNDGGRLTLFSSTF